MSTIMSKGACLPYKHMPSPNLSLIRNIHHRLLTDHKKEDFYEGNNYELIIQCLDAGHSHSKILVKIMKNYCKFLRKDISNRRSFHSKCISNSKWSSIDLSYRTTKRAQTELLQSIFQEEISPIETRQEKIKQLITSYERQVNAIYPSRRLHIHHKHHKSEEMEKAFVDAQANLRQINLDLANLEQRKQQTETDFDNADKTYKRLEENATRDEKALKNTKHIMHNKQKELKGIRKEIDQKKIEQEKERAIYREKAEKLYEKCRGFEEKRLQLFQEHLIEFVQIIHPQEYITKQSAIYDDLLSKIRLSHHIPTDLDSWAQTYKVYNAETDNDEVTDESTFDNENE